MKSYTGNWQINRNSRNRMSEKILSERMANEITELLRRDRKRDMDVREDFKHVLFTKLTKSNDRAISDNRSWYPRVFTRPAVIWPDLSVGQTVFRFHCKLFVISFHFVTHSTSIVTEFYIVDFFIGHGVVGVLI
jgi:hypothetical protein